MPVAKKPPPDDPRAKLDLTQLAETVPVAELGKLARRYRRESEDAARESVAQGVFSIERAVLAGKFYAAVRDKLKRQRGQNFTDWVRKHENTYTAVNRCVRIFESDERGELAPIIASLRQVTLRAVMRALAGPSRRKRTAPAAEPREPAAPPGPGAADDRQDDDADGEIPQDVRDRLLSKGWPADDIAEMTVAEAIAVDGDNTRKLADGSMLRGGSGDGTPPPGPPPPPPPDPFERCDWRLFTTDAEGNEKLRAEQWCQRATWTQIKEGVEQRAPKLPPGWFYSAFVMVDGVEQFACVWPAIGMNTGDPGDFLKPSSLEPGIDQPEAFRAYHFPDYAARRVGWQVLSDDEFKVMWLTVLADRFPRVRCIRDEGEAAPPVVPEDASVVPEQPSDAASPAPPSAPKKKWYAIWNKATGKWTGHGRPRTFGTKAIAKSEMRNVMYEDKLTGMKIKDLEVRLYEQEPA